MLFSGSCICSKRVLATCAIQTLKGSAFDEGIDWIMRKSCSVSATSVMRNLPSEARSFKRLQICNRLIAFFYKPVFQYFPVVSRMLSIWLFRQHTAHIHDGEIPFFLLVVPYGAYLLFFKQLKRFLLRHISICYI